MELVSHLPDKMLFAVPKKGRLAEKCNELLKGADVQFRRSHRLDIAISTNLPIALVFLPAADIPRFVGEGNCVLGITGIDQVQESGLEVEDLIDLNFGSCKLQVQVPEAGEFSDPKQLIGKNIVTSFTKLTEAYFSKLEGKPVAELATKIKHVGGSVEAAVALGVADAIVDLVESGETMRAAGLRAISTVLDTSAHLIASKDVGPHQETVNLVKRRLEGVLASQKYVLCNYNARREHVQTLLTVTPGRRAATVSSLDSEGWCAISAMVEKKKIAEVMDELTRLGAEDILVISLANCRV